MAIDNFDIAVVGGGATGLAAAIGGAQRGYSTILLAPTTKSVEGRTAALLGRSADLLRTLEVWATLQPKSAPLRRMRLVDATRRIWRAPEIVFEASEIGCETFGHNVTDKDLVEALRDAADACDGLEIRNEAAADITPGDDGVQIVGVGGARISARLLVAADGRHSIARRSAGITAQEWAYPQKALVAILEHDADHEETSTEFQSEAGPFTLVPLPGRRSSLVWMDEPSVIDSAEAMTGDAFDALVSERSDYLLGRLRLTSSRATLPMQALLANRFSANRMVLVGEAAHAFPPIGAQGLNLGLRDVAALHQTLSDTRGGDPGASDNVAAYQARRGADIRLRTMGVDLLNRSLLSSFLPIHLARSAGFRTAGRFAAARRLLMRTGLGPLQTNRSEPLQEGHGGGHENAL